MKSSVMIFLLLLVAVPAFAQYGNETITITTYYPSPHGVYGVLTLYPRDSQPDLAISRKGDLYYDNGTEDPTNRPEGVYAYNGSTWAPINLGGGGSPSGANYTVEISRSCYPSGIHCICPESFSGSPGPIPAGSKVISCSSGNTYNCHGDCPMMGELCQDYYPRAALCNATISGNTISVNLFPPPPPLGPCGEDIVGIRPPPESCYPNFCDCHTWWVSATVTYGN
jgi:hypothetical protein